MSGLMIRYPFPLGDGRLGSVELPEDVTRADVERLCEMVRALPLDGEPEPFRPIPRGESEPARLS